MKYATNPYDGATIANPLADTIADGERIIDQLRDASDRLQQAIRDERQTYGSLQEMRDLYDGAEAETIAESVVEAASAKTGPLGGIPVSGDGYKYAMTALKTKLRNGLLNDMYEDLDARRLQYEQAQIERQQAEVQFSGLKHVADLMTAILRAAAL